ncbi:MAG: hypothetical protein ABIK09_03055 [Pseudomonadota bacterium]
MTDETKVPSTGGENVGAEAPPTGEEGNRGVDAPPTGEEGNRGVNAPPPGAAPLRPSPDAPPPPPPTPQPKVKIPKGMGPPGWMAPVAILLIIIGLAAFSYSAWSYASGVAAGLHAGEQALLAVKTMEDARASTLETQEKALTTRGIELKRAAITASDQSETLRSDARFWGFVGIGPLLIGLILMIVYRKKKERARARAR